MNNLTKKLLQGLEELKINPDSPIIAGVYKPVFQIFLNQTLGEVVDLSSAENLKKAELRLKLLPPVSGKLDDFNRIYNIAQTQCDFGQHELQLDKNRGVSDDKLRLKGADLVAKSVIYTTVALSLPETHLGNPAIITRLSHHIFSQEKTLDNPNLAQNLKENIKTVINEVKAPILPDQKIDALTKQAVNAISEPLKESGGGKTTTFVVAASIVSLLSNLSGPPQPEEIIEREEEQEKAGFSEVTTGTTVGLGIYGLMTKLKKDKEKREKNPKITPKKPGSEKAKPWFFTQDQPSSLSISSIPQPTNLSQKFPQSPTSSGVSSFLTKITGVYLKKNLSSFFKVAAGVFFKKLFSLGLGVVTGGASILITGVLSGLTKTFSFLGSLTSRLNLVSSDDSLKNVNRGIILILCLLFIPLVIVFLFINVFVYPTALISEPGGPSSQSGSGFDKERVATKSASPVSIGLILKETYPKKLSFGGSGNNK